MSYVPLVETGMWVNAVYDVLSNESTQSLSTNGNYTINGRTWTKFNSGNDSVAMALTNGTGLVMKPASGTDYNGSSRTLPGIYLPLTTLIPSARYGMGLRMMARVSSYNGAANYDAFVMGVDSASAASPHQNAWMAKRGNGTSSVGFQGFTQTSSVNNGFYSSPGLTLNTTNNVMIVEIPCLGELHFNVDYAPDASLALPGPTFSGIRRAVPYDVSFFSSGLNMQQLDLTTLAFTLGAQRSGSGTSLNVTVSEFRIDYRKAA